MYDFDLPVLDKEKLIQEQLNLIYFLERGVTAKNLPDEKKRIFHFR